MIRELSLSLACLVANPHDILRAKSDIASPAKANLIGVTHSPSSLFWDDMSLDPSATERQLDVREIEGEPFEDIMTALEALPADESLLLINSFEPEPLYNIMEQRGFEYETANPEPEVWYVEIHHE